MNKTGCHVFPVDLQSSFGFYKQEERQINYTYLAYVKGWIYTAANIHDNICSDVLVIKKKKVKMFTVMNTIQGEKAEKQFLPGQHWYRTFLWAILYFKRKKQYFIMLQSLSCINFRIIQILLTSLSTDHILLETIGEKKYLLERYLLDFGSSRVR